MAGGNSALKPDTANSVNAGLVYAPERRTNLRLSLNYFYIKQNKRVSIFQPATLLQSENSFPDRVVRAAPTPTDIAANQPGAIQSVDISALNFGSIQTDGVDLDAGYSFRVGSGKIALDVNATWVSRFKVVTIPGGVAIDRVGLAAGIAGTIPEYRTVGTVAWSDGPISLAATARYNSGYDDVGITGAPNGKHLPSRTLVDLQTAYRTTGEGVFGDLTFNVGVINLFNARPRFSEALVAQRVGFDPTQTDTRGRFGYVRLTKVF